MVFLRSLAAGQGLTLTFINKRKKGYLNKVDIFLECLVACTGKQDDTRSNVPWYGRQGVSDGATVIIWEASPKEK